MPTKIVPLNGHNGNEPRGLIDRATIVIEFLNLKTGRRYPSTNPRGRPTAHAELISQRLRDGYTVQDCKSVIALKWREWGADDKMSRYLTPTTLFRRSNFERYIGEIGDDDSEE